jgi:hypothetical protein
MEIRTQGVTVPGTVASQTSIVMAARHCRQSNSAWHDGGEFRRGGSYLYDGPN